MTLAIPRMSKDLSISELQTQWVSPSAGIGLTVGRIGVHAGVRLWPAHLRPARRRIWTQDLLRCRHGLVCSVLDRLRLRQGASRPPDRDLRLDLRAPLRPAGLVGSRSRSRLPGRIRACQCCDPTRARSLDRLRVLRTGRTRRSSHGQSHRRSSHWPEPVSNPSGGTS